MGRSLINVDNAKKGLSKYPFTDIAQNLVHGLEFGFKLKYSGPRRPVEISTKGIVGERSVVAKNKILKEINMGRIAGPFPTPPFPTFRVSPIAVIPKKSSSEFRLIHNLSFPLNESVNDFIDKDQCRLNTLV